MTPTSAIGYSPIAPPALLLQERHKQRKQTVEAYDSPRSEFFEDAMQHPAPENLRDALQAALKRRTGAILATVSAEGMPSTAFCSWIVSAGPDRLALALDSRSTAHRNIGAGTAKVALEILADDLILAVRGEARILKEQLRTVPFPCALVSVQIAEVRDHGVDGVVFTAPTYLFADGKEHRGEVENAIFEELAQHKPIRE